ncbi:MAG: chorismate lyase [Halioglobus sp.]
MARRPARGVCAQRVSCEQSHRRPDTPAQAAEHLSGAILFSDPAMRRSPFELTQMPGNSDYLHPQLRQDAPAWGRRSRFDISGKALLVSEVFLEAFTPWPAGLSLPRSQRGRVSTAILPATQ